MMISYSEVRQFRQCQRKWFFKNVVANAVAKDAARREAYVLSKLQSVSAWRGSIVDAVLSRHGLPELRRRGRMSADTMVREARALFDRQLRFAKAHRVREPNLRVSACGDAFAALFDVEYGAPITEAALAEAWDDIEQSLRNAAAMTALLEALRGGQVLIQPRLFFYVAEVRVAATPDLVWFGPERTLRILDWKAHSFGLRAAKEQLIVYLCALRGGQRQAHFPWDVAGLPLEQCLLTEVQLIKNEVHDYTAVEDDIDESIDKLFDASERIRLACGEGADCDLRAEEFPPTPWPESCLRCSFKRLCLERAA
jgi:PD-(D/E)XK nuclease superfamily protein